MSFFSKSPTNLHRWTSVAFLTFLCVMVGLVVFSPQPYVSDESWHLNTVGLIHEHGLGYDLIKNWHASTGPLVGIVHWIAEPITKLGVTSSRLVNTTFLIGAALLTGSILALGSGASVWQGAVGLLALPPLWKVGGIVYSEPPALFFFVLALAILQFACVRFPASSKNWKVFLLLIFAGQALGLSALGRQPLIAVALCALAAAVVLPTLRWYLVSFGLAALPLPVWVFYCWGGLQAPINDNSLLDPMTALFFGIAGLGYMGGMAALLSPRWLLSSQVWWKWVVAMVPGCVIAVMVIVKGEPLFLPGATLFEKFVPEALLLPTSALVFFTIGLLGGLYLTQLASVWLTSKADPFLRFLIISLAGLSMVPAAIGPLFSSRYLITAMPLLVLVVPPFTEGSLWWRAGRAFFGASLGVLSLWSYLFVATGPAFWDNRMEIFYPHLWQGRAQSVFSEEQWKKFDYGNSPYIQEPRWSEPVTRPWTPNPIPPK